MLPLHYGKSMSPTTSEGYLMDRKVKKPLMEKYRRKRINDSLESLKEFVLMFDQGHNNVLKKQLEKADILERTVECLKTIIVYPKESRQLELERKESFDEGFNAATRAVLEYLSFTMPPFAISPAQQQFQIGLITHLRVTKHTHQPVRWSPISPKSDKSSPSPQTEGSCKPRKRPWQPWN